jgi:hypothetical protein
MLHCRFIHSLPQNCLCHDCFDLRIFPVAERATWIPRDPVLSPYKMKVLIGKNFKWTQVLTGGDCFVSFPPFAKLFMRIFFFSFLFFSRRAFEVGYYHTFSTVFWWHKTDRLTQNGTSGSYFTQNFNRG